jgi:hypothetical protein
MGEPVTLDVPVMSAREAARQLRMPPATLTHWLEGGVRGDRRYEPILGPESTGVSTISWGEMVEARYLRAYRRDLNVSMQQSRPFVAAYVSQELVMHDAQPAAPRSFVDNVRHAGGRQNMSGGPTRGPNFVPLSLRGILGR